MTPLADDDRLVEIAGSISDGAPVDWSALREELDDPADAGVIEALQLLHGIATVHANPAGWDSLAIGEAIGQGSFATVYRAFDADLQRDVAVKITALNDRAAFDAQRAVLEARMLARIRHANVVTVFGARRKDNEVAVIMELIKGETLDQLVSRQGALSAREATLIGVDLCRALAAVHGAGLLHGDIKAHNVMREEGGRIVLMDFGTGKDLRGAAHPGGDFAGTPVYLAPEVFTGQARTPASDIYSLGVLLYYLATARYPVEGGTRTEIDRRHSEGAARHRLRDIRPDLPDRFIRVVETALATDASARFQTAGGFEAALASTFDDRTTKRWARPAPNTVVAALVAVGLTGGVVYFGVDRFTARQPPERPDVESVAAFSGGAAAQAVPAVYQVEAAMFRVEPDGPRRLQRGAQLSPGNRLFLQLRASVPVHVYVVNEDDEGESNLLFPLPGPPVSPLPADSSIRLPGLRGAEEMYWQVTTPGRREHFVIFVSPQRVDEVEQLVAALPAPRRDEPVSHTLLSREEANGLRSVGGLVVTPQAQGGRLSARYTTPLGDAPESADGLWVRQIAFDNPVN